MRFKRFRFDPWTTTALAVGGIILLHVALPWVLPVDDRSPARWDLLVAKSERRLSINLENVPLQNALARISRLGEVEIWVDWERLADIGKRPSTPVNVELTAVPARRAVDRVMISAGFPPGWMELDRRGAIVISDRIETVIRRYDTRTATDPTGAELAQGVQEWFDMQAASPPSTDTN